MGSYGQLYMLKCALRFGQTETAPGFLLKDTLKVIYNIKNIVTNTCRIADNNT